MLSLLVAGLAGCSTTRELPPQEARIVTPADAMIMPPVGGPAISKVVSTTYPNALKQDISLVTQARTPGENKISVILFEGAGGDGSDARLKDVPFTQVNLTEEALAAWPDTGMAVSPYYVQNAYGPFGYAIGKPANGDTCIYAWQRIEPTTRPSGSVGRGTIFIRLQLCKQRATEQELLAVMYQLRLDVSVFPPGRAPARIGALSAPIVPVGAQGFAEVIPTSRPPAQPRPTPPTVRTVPVVQTPVVVTPPPGTPIVPTPTGTPVVPTPPGSGVTGPTVPLPPTNTVIVPPPPGGQN
ncbi:MAG: cellulose biosynthesis protein BcsN [Devosia sp.]|uniref:cellulose biosynthesis protein BcsN n=1 Tax=Devosia sp. TaxID=1871048 RepID=UPI0024C7C11F|nr:cellulose biosynthesis protein BcsN [Devosia sp.]UYN99171.1 MAG: cellulose biosynthesis protein BcsN [Devosia sp.]